MNLQQRVSPAEEDDVVRILSGRAVTSICTAGTLRDGGIKKQGGEENEKIVWKTVRSVHSILSVAINVHVYFCKTVCSRGCKGDY